MGREHLPGGGGSISRFNPDGTIAAPTITATLYQPLAITVIDDTVWVTNEGYCCLNGRYTNGSISRFHFDGTTMGPSITDNGCRTEVCWGMAQVGQEVWVIQRAGTLARFNLDGTAIIGPGTVEVVNAAASGFNPGDSIEVIGDPASYELNETGKIINVNKGPTTTTLTLEKALLYPHHQGDAVVHKQLTTQLIKFRPPVEAYNLTVSVSPKGPSDTNSSSPSASTYIGPLTPIQYYIAACFPNGCPPTLAGTEITILIGCNVAGPTCPPDQSVPTLINPTVAQKDSLDPWLINVTLTPFIGPPITYSTVPIRADVDQNGHITILDLARIINTRSQPSITNYSGPEDINFDGILDETDLQMFLDKYTQLESPEI